MLLSLCYSMVFYFFLGLFHNKHTGDQGKTIQNLSYGFMLYSESGKNSIIASMNDDPIFKMLSLGRLYV